MSHDHYEPATGYTFVPESEEGLTATRLHRPHPNEPFEPLPPPTGKPPFHFSLAKILSPQAIEAIQSAGKLVFHIVGDTGDKKDRHAQVMVAKHLLRDFDRPEPTDRPAFFYHLGDVVYPRGEASRYYDQFYEPYEHYPAPILAIPGNHDGQRSRVEPAPSLASFMTNFCARSPQISPDSGDIVRTTMTQPNCYWTLDAPFVTIIGLYTNVPSGGEIDDNQKAWLEEELRNAPADKALIVTMHHPIYSVEKMHNGSVYLRDVLDQATQRAGRMPNAVFAGHAHNYQRFTRSYQGRDVPYIVAGTGGHYKLRPMPEVDGKPIEVPFEVPDTDTRLEAYCDTRYGFMRVTVTPERLRGAYFTVPRRRSRLKRAATKFDSFKLHLLRHCLA